MEVQSCSGLKKGLLAPASCRGAYQRDVAPGPAWQTTGTPRSLAASSTRIDTCRGDPARPHADRRRGASPPPDRMCQLSSTASVSRSQITVRSQPPKMWSAFHPPLRGVYDTHPRLWGWLCKEQAHRHGP
jgi:hypothetical protein